MLAVSIIIFIQLIVSCQNNEEKDKLLISTFFIKLSKVEIENAIKYTDREAKELFSQIDKELSSEVKKIIFSNLKLVSVEKEDTYYGDYNIKRNQRANVYRVKYSCNIQVNSDSEEIKKMIEDAKNGEALFFIENGKIVNIVDIKGGVFRY